MARLTAEEIADVLIASAEHLAPIDFDILVAYVGADAAEPLRPQGRAEGRTGLGTRDGWIRATSYTRARQPNWPPARDLVIASVQHYLEQDPPRTRAPADDIILRLAAPGERYPTYDFSDEAARTGGFGDATADGRHVVLLAFAGPRLVGAARWNHVDGLNEEQMDTADLKGPDTAGPLFCERPDDYGGHVMALDSFWVAPDRRRGGVSRAMAAFAASYGVPALATFRDPMVAAFFLQEHGPAPIGQTAYGRAYVDWLQQEDCWYATATVRLRLQPHDDIIDDLRGWDAPLETICFSPDDDYRTIDYGGFELEEIDSSWEGDSLVGTITVTFEEFAFTGLETLAAWLSGDPAAPPAPVTREAAVARRLRRAAEASGTVEIEVTGTEPL